MVLAFTPSTGDKVLDTRLDAINTYAAKDQEAFVSGLSSTYHVDRTTLEGMLNQGMSPADVYMTLRLGNVPGQTPEQVEKAYLNNPGKGWGVIAKSLGIKPGSPEFRSLKSEASAFTGKAVKDKNTAAAGEKAQGKEKGTTGQGSDKSGDSGKGNSGNSGGQGGGNGSDGGGGKGK